MISYPNIDPIIFEIGPFAIRWYSVAYIIGIVGGCWYADLLNKKPPIIKNLKVSDDFMVWVIFGIILGGRMGYVLFYNLPFYLENPLDTFKVWQGGMSFHGGLIGFIISTAIFCRKHKINPLALLDLAACVTPIGLFCGRIANFINGELYGRVTTSQLGMVFPNGGPLPRHPSQLYEATSEGLFIFTLMFLLTKYTNIKAHTGRLSGIFLCCYSLSRILMENFREPDEQIGFLIGNVTTGQILSFPMLLLGLFLVAWKVR